MPEGERGPVVRDRDHRLECVVERERRTGVLERTVGGDVLGLDDDGVGVVQLARLHASLGFSEDAELVKGRGDHVFVGTMGEEGGRETRIADPEADASVESGDEPVELAHQILGAGLGTPGRDRRREEGRDDHEGDQTHAGITAARPRCFSV